jgi:hypothetical protein
MRTRWAKILREMGFEVSEGVDLDRAGLQNLVTQFLRSAPTARVALVLCRSWHPDRQPQLSASPSMSNVVAATKNNQVPRSNSPLLGEVYLVR